MILLFIFLFLMLVVALVLLATSLIKSTEKKYSYFIAAGFMIVFSLLTYGSSTHWYELKNWLIEGQEHYQTQEKFITLGGTKGIIAKIEKKLETNPRDAQGWFILGKLYFAEQDYQSALASLKTAKELDPHNAEITAYYDMVLQSIGEKHAK